MAGKPWHERPPRWQQQAARKLMKELDCNYTTALRKVRESGDPKTSHDKAE